MTGAEMIAAERQRQIEAEGWTPEHDDKHFDGALAIQAAALAIDGTDARITHMEMWPTERVDPWKLVEKHHGNWIRELVIAGALIAAEIDRQKRMSSVPEMCPAKEMAQSH